MIKLVFILKMYLSERQSLREGETEKDLLSSGSLPYMITKVRIEACQGQQSGAASTFLTGVAKGPKTWGIFHYFPGYMSRELDEE